MTTLVALNSKKHHLLKIDTGEVESQGGHLHMVPVVLTEFAKLSLQYPIVVTKNQDNGRFTCVTLFGLEKGENLFFNGNEWNSIYLPLQIRRQPFFLGKSEEDDKRVICIDMSHASIINENSMLKENGKKLFNADGSETQYLADLKNILAELSEGENTTQLFIQELLSMNLLQPMQLQIALENEQSFRVDGLYTINEQALTKVTSENLISLHHKNFLHPIYIMLTSIGHIYGLIDKKNKRNRNV
ncbi:MAG: peptidase [Gammaproteobacteria bacterium]|nr:MAG: peptidase [Gammaproteobacteria bacterium]